MNIIHRIRIKIRRITLIRVRFPLDTIKQNILKVRWILYSTE